MAINRLLALLVAGVLVPFNPLWAGPVVLELFTSQGCSSCPPAEAYLQELARNPEVIALSFHVDYWDGLGWKDPFSNPMNTQRQRDYATNGRVYTPEVRVNGSDSVVGSDRVRLPQAIQSAKPITLLQAKNVGSGWEIALPESKWDGAEVNVFKVRGQGFTEIKAGENFGLAMKEINIVTAIQKLPNLTPRQVLLRVPGIALAEGEHAVVLLQKPHGPILAARILP